MIDDKICYNITQTKLLLFLRENMATVIDNISTLLGDDLKRSLPKSRLKIAASCFSIYAWEALKDELSKIDSLEFIFTAPAFIPPEDLGLGRKEQREFFIPKAGRERCLYGSEFEIKLRNKLTQKAVARECAEWLARKAVFRSNKTNAPMQEFICTESREQGDVVYTPARGFTAADLGYQKSDAVSSFCARLDVPTETRRFIELFNRIWNSPDQLADVTEAVYRHMSTVYQENAPAQIYFLMLYHIFEKFLEDIDEDVLPNDRTGFRDTLVWRKLFNFQADAAVGIINKLETYNGCILADSVGLGKTFTALAVIKYYELRNKSVLVLCPKKLADNWLTYNRNLTTNIFCGDRFNYDVFCHTDLSRDRGQSFGVHLNQVNWSNYDLVVIDESHNFRNNEAFREHETRYQRLMNRVIRGGVKTKVLMLSATPVNNRFVDLKNQLALAYEGDQTQLAAKLTSGRSIDEIFRRAQAAFNQWSRLEPEERTPQAIMSALDFDFFELLDSVTIARSRKHIQTFYDTRDIGGFPARRPPISHRPPLTDLPGVMDFNDIYERLSRLTLAVYAPISYVHPSRLSTYEALYDTQVGGGRAFRQIDRERSLQALMTTNLLKRLESSVESFRRTLHRLIRLMLDNWEQVHEYQASRMKAERYIRQRGLDPALIDDLEFDGDDFLATSGKVKIDLGDMDLKSWTRDLHNDLELLNEIQDSLASVTSDHDAKLQHLLRAVLDKVASPINPGNRKLLIFTAFSDTAEYIYDRLAPVLRDHGLQAGLVTGSGTPLTTLGKGYDFQSVLTLFSPKSKEKDKTLPQVPGELDVLIGTDCISEGQNLQDCDYVINYDIHWNPVRIIQRFGRVDRIGSTNRFIQLVNYWPDISLDEYIKLKARVESRMVIADLSATGDDNPLGLSGDLAYRREQLRRLQEEVIELEDLKTGVSITDLGLNDFRMDLLNHVKEHGDLAASPLGLQAVVPADPALGLEPGCVFALRRIGAAADGHLLHPYYLVYVDREGKVRADYTEVKKILDLLRYACRERHEPVPEAFAVFNRETRDGADMTAYTKLLNETIKSIIEVREERDIDSLFSGGSTSVLEDSFSGLDDFELIAFLVVV